MELMELSKALVDRFTDFLDAALRPYLVSPLSDSEPGAIAARAESRRDPFDLIDARRYPGRELMAGAVGQPPGSQLEAKEKVEEVKELVLSNADIHSLEAWIFGVQALTTEIGQIQRALLEMQHAEELDMVF
jgi:hypothetical protein